MERMNKAREVGWQNLLPGVNKDKEAPKEAEVNQIKPAVAADIIRVDQYPYVNFVRGGAYNNYVSNQNENDNIYARYHQQLDEFIERRKPVLEQQQQLAKRFQTPPATPPVNQQQRQIAPVGVRRALANVGNSRPGSKNSQILEDFLKRKAEFERNKARVQQQIHGGQPGRVVNVINNVNNNKPPVNVRVYDEKSAYEQRLERIRQQNYANRRLLAQRNRPALVNDVLPNHRLQKAAALRVRMCRVGENFPKYL